MFARVHMLETGPEEYERGEAMVRDVLLPWARESTGFCGLIGLADEAREQSLVITLWADEAAAGASEIAGDRLGALAATAAGATRVSLKEYAVTIYDMPPGARAEAGRGREERRAAVSASQPTPRPDPHRQ